MGDEVLPWRFIEAGTVTVSNEYPEADTPAEAQFLAVSNRYGFTAIYTWKSHLLFAKTARLFDLAKTKADLLETPAADVFQAPVKGFVKGLYLSGDELVLALAKRRSVLFFSAKALEHKDPTPLGKVRICASKEESVTQLSWHPVVPNLLLALSSKGKVTLIDSTTKRSYDWGAGLPGDIVSLTWSSSGKSVLCGGKSGDVLCVNKDGQLRAKFPKPDSAFSGEECEAHQVVPISGRTIGVAYRPVANPGDSMFYLMDLPKELTGEAKMTQVNYLGMPNPQRTSLYHFGQVKDWKLLMVGGSNFAEIEVVSTESTESTAGDEPLDPLSLNDSFRAQVPMRAQGDDNHLIGLAFDFTKSDPMPDPTNSDRTPFAPSPVLFLLIDEGKLIAYVFVKTNLPKDETLKLPFMMQPAPIPATQALDPLASKPDLVPSVALSASADGAGAGTPLSPSAQRNSLRQASHGLGTAAKPTAPSTSTPVPVAGGSASFTFGAPPGAGTSAFSFSALAPAATTKPEDTATKPSIFSFGAPSGSTTAPAGAALPAFSFEPAKPAADVPGASTFSLGTSASAASKKPPAFSFAPSGSAKAPAGAAPPAFSFEAAKPAADMPGAGASTFSFAPAATKKPEVATTKPPSFSFAPLSGSAGAAPPAFAFEPKPAADMPKPSPLGLAGKPTAATPPLSFTPGDAPSSDAPPAKRRQPTAEPSKPISFQPPAATPTSRAAVAAAAGPKITLPAPTMAEPRVTAPTPVVATAARPKITTPAPAPVTAAEPKPREPVARRPVVGEGGDARDLQNQFIEHIASFEQVLDEVRAAERETAKLMHKIENGPATPGEFTQAGLVRLRKRTDQLVDDINAITEQNLQQQRTRKQVHDDYMEAVGLYTDADSLFHAKTDKQYQLLLNNRKLDAESAAMRKNIQKLSADVEIKMAEVETHLQRMWNVQRRKEKKAMRVPVGDTLYRTLKSYDEIAQRQAIQLQDLSEEFEKLRMQSEYASTLSLGLAVSPSRTASPAGKKSPFAREQRRERNGEEEDGTPRRVRDSGLEQLGTLNGKEYTERMKELKKIISQRVRNTPRRRPAEKKQPVAGIRYPEAHQSWQQQPQESRMAGTPTTPSSASSSSSFVGAVPVRADKPAPPQFSGNGEKNAAASTTKPLGRWDQPSAKSSPPPAAAASFSFAPSTAGSAAQASSFSFGASLTAGDKSKAAKPLGRSDQPPATSSPAPSFSFAPSAAGSAAPASSFSFAPSAAGSAAQAPSFSFGASLTAGDKPKAGAPLTTATTPDKGTTASAGGFGGGSFSLPSFNVPETKPISVSSPTSPPQRLVPVNLVAGYSRSESDEEDDEEDDEEGPYDEESEEGEDEDDDDEYPDEDDEEDEYPDLGPSSGSKLGTLPAPASTKPSGADSLFDFKPLPNPLATVAADVRPPGEFSFGPSVAPITSGTSKGKPATAVDAEPASSGLTLGVAGTPKQLAKSPVAKSLFGSADDTPATFSFAAAPSASSAPSLSSASTASSAETSTPAASSSSAPAFSLSSAPAAAASSAAAAPSFTFPSTTTAAAPEKPAASPAAFTAFAPTAAASTPATGSTSTPAPAPFGAFSFASGGDKPATSGLASSAPAAVSSGSALGSFSFASGGDKPASSAPAAVSSGSALGSFSFSSAPAGATSAAPAATAASPFGSFSFASTPATGGAAAPAAAAPAAAAASTGASPFGSFSFSSTPTASAPGAGAGAAPFGAASASAPAASTGSLFGGLSLGTSQPASSPAANPFGSGLSASTAGAASTSSPFGAPSASSAAPAASPFGASAASTPASGGMSLFGATSSLPTLASSSLSTPTFGSTSTFGTPAATSSPFGAAASAAPAFGAPAFGQPAFGAPSPLSGSAGGGFGTPAFGSVSPFGATAASAAPAAGGQQRTFGSGFGSAASGTGGGGFASFASGTGGGGFASIASGTGGGFGAAANTGGFGGASAGTGGGFSSLLPSTGASPFGAAPAGDVWGAIRK